MRSPIAAVRIADSRSRDARASVFTVSAVAEVSIGCPGPKVPGSQRSYEWNIKAVGASSARVVAILTFTGDSPCLVCTQKCHRPLDPWMRGGKNFSWSSCLIIPQPPNNCMQNSSKRVRGCQRQRLAYKASDSPSPKKQCEHDVESLAVHMAVIRNHRHQRGFKTLAALLTVLLFTVWASSLLAQQFAGSQALSAQSAHRALLDKYCVTCHSNTLRTGGVSVEGLDLLNLSESAETWEKVIRKLRVGAMPPQGMLDPKRWP